MSNARPKLSLPAQMVIGLVVGVLVGLVVSADVCGTYFRPLGQLFHVDPHGCGASGAGDHHCRRSRHS